MLSFKLKEEQAKTIVNLMGDLDIDATEVIEEELNEVLQFTSGIVELDFKNIDFVDSSGIGLLITLISVLKENNRKPTIINLSDNVKLVFEILQLHEILGEDVVSVFYN